ncbi:MAG: F0F1 ATP synthase subunit A [Anaerolineales bacterium]|nr:F0F1 ATP synthase subunit A [Anaerolineales bacterium]
MSEEKKKKRYGFKRWIVIGLIILGAYCAFFGPTIYKPVSPVVVLPPEPTGLSIFGFQITNTILGTLIADIVLLLIAYFGAYQFAKTGKLVPSGITNAFEAIIEFLWNTVEGAAGKWAKKIFPIPATIFLIVFMANMVKLVPGFESIGYLKGVHKGEGYAPVKLFNIGSLDVFSIDKGQPHEVEESGEHEISASSEGESHESGGMCTACEIVPYLRGSATDLNFTIALGILAVLFTQVFGVWAGGIGYFGKFIAIKQLISGGIFGAINFIVGLLELILEFMKIVSFGFRLFGNVFGGAILLSVIGALVAVGVPPLLYIFELFFGVIQAYVFFLLATIFISMATVSHH